MRQTSATTLKTYMADLTLTTAAQTNITSVGALGGGSIASGFGNVDIGSSTFTTTGALATGTVTATGIVDITGTTDSSDASGDTGILRVEGGASIAKKLYIGTDLDVDGTANLDVVDIDGAVDMASTLQVDGAITSSAGMTITTADNTDTLTLKSTDADANTGPTLFMQRDSASPADGDSIGKISFVADNDAGETTRFARIDNQISDASDGTEDGMMFITTMIGGSELSRITLQPTVSVFNEESADIDFRVESNGNANMVFVDGGNDKVAIGTATATATLTVAGSAVAGTDTDTSNTGNVTLDFTANQNFVLTMTGNVTLVNPTTENVGQSGFITLIQDGTGSRTLAVGDQYFGSDGDVPEISTAANAIDIIPYVVIAAGKILLGSAQKAFSDAS
jgi:hypothetical protein